MRFWKDRDVIPLNEREKSISRKRAKVGVSDPAVAMLYGRGKQLSVVDWLRLSSAVLRTVDC
jgi:hypothetical protein